MQSGCQSPAYTLSLSHWLALWRQSCPLIHSPLIPICKKKDTGLAEHGSDRLLNVCSLLEQKTLRKDRLNTGHVTIAVLPVVILGQEPDFPSLSFLYLLMEKLLPSMLRIKDNISVIPGIWKPLLLLSMNHVSTIHHVHYYFLHHHDCCKLCQRICDVTLYPEFKPIWTDGKYYLEWYTIYLSHTNKAILSLQN